MAYEDKLVAPALKFRSFLDKTPNIYNPYIISIISCIAGMMFGFDISSMSAFVSLPAYVNYFDTPSAVIQGFITSAMALGSFFGSIASAFVSEPFGRRASLLTCSWFWMIGAAIQASSQNRAQLIIGRIISGFGVGFGSSVAPVYGSEMAPRKIRGRIGGIFQLSVTLGIMIMFFISYGTSHIKTAAAFRLAWALQIIPGLLMCIGVFFIPESPRWLAKQGHWDEAEIIVAKIQAKGDRENPDVLIEISEIKDQLMVDENAKAFTYADLFSKKYLPRTITAMFAQIWQQLTGMNVMMYYIVYIFEMAGYGGNGVLVSSTIQYVIFVVVTFVSLFFLDKFGRRKILLVGAASMMTWQFAVAGILARYSVPYDLSDTVKIKIPDNHKSAAKGVIACCYLFVASFGFSWGVGIWLYCSEVWGDSQSRQRGAAVSTASNWIFNFALAMFTPSSFKNITWKTYCIYATFCACMFIHVFFFFPETKGKRLEEIAQIWEEKIPAWKTTNWQPHVPLLSDHELAEKINAEHVENVNSREQSDDEKSQV
ncbi:hypothetical protein PGUG_05859 [Meyerozyma guilliermondii ATCC 6260]|uniref:Major facilitator superfamily (MFS) profile domain-containing protein n=2 Tax=Dikarya TaxID=451864 RepID=A5DRF8_PICGU|nr:uncharacterized protein PGUG_05859 [Meyerozyma guilliermondii ATCC 6260]EDK41761.1 hypothetical protein PGUG_05859 [Meyerozyma guilliermondii ATCC 6260]